MPLTWAPTEPRSHVTGTVQEIAEFNGRKFLVIKNELGLSMKIGLNKSLEAALMHQEVTPGDKIQVWFCGWLQSQKTEHKYKSYKILKLE